MAIDLSNVPERKQRSLAIIERELRASDAPSRLTWFEVGGHILFPVYGHVGLTQAGIAILAEKFPDGATDFGRYGLHEEANGRWFTLEFSIYDDRQTVSAKVDEALAALRSHGHSN